MRQLPLPLGDPPAPSFDNFVAGDNQECVARLRDLAAGQRQQRFFYLWGPPASGRSHLLTALVPGPADRAAAAAKAGSVAVPAAVRAPGVNAWRFDPQAALPDFDRNSSNFTICLADDIDRLDDDGQVALFHLINRVQAHPEAALVMAGSQPPQSTLVREDLRTRLGAALVFQLHPLSDADKRVALQVAAHQRGVVISPDLLDYLLVHFPRDLGSLMVWLDALDRYAMQEQRAMTVPLLRELTRLAIVPTPPKR